MWDLNVNPFLNSLKYYYFRIFWEYYCNSKLLVFARGIGSRTAPESKTGCGLLLAALNEQQKGQSIAPHPFLHLAAE
jgi:hypothetical protein